MKNILTNLILVLAFLFWKCYQKIDAKSKEYLVNKEKFRNIAFSKNDIMNYTTEKQEKYIVLKLNNDKLNDLIASQLKEHLSELHEEGVRNIILDLSAVSYCDSSGLSAILIGSKLCKKAKGSFVICGLKVNVQRVITISQLDKILLICPSVSEAIDLVYMEEIERELLDVDPEE